MKVSFLSGYSDEGRAVELLYDLAVAGNNQIVRGYHPPKNEGPVELYQPIYDAALKALRKAPWYSVSLKKRFELLEKYFCWEILVVLFTVHQIPLQQFLKDGILSALNGIHNTDEAAAIIECFVSMPGATPEHFALLLSWTQVLDGGDPCRLLAPGMNRWKDGEVEKAFREPARDMVPAAVSYWLECLAGYPKQEALPVV